MYTTGPLTINISGVAALNPAMAGQVQTNPALAGLMYGSINEAAVPIEEGWVKLRGLDPAITKQDICTFFEVMYLSMPSSRPMLCSSSSCLLCSPCHSFLNISSSTSAECISACQCSQLHEYCGHCMHFV